MNDRFKFRGKRVDNGEWLEGNLIQMSDHIMIMNRNLYMEVDPKTIGQCTGFKDKNGTLIFEGDIISCGTPQCRKIVSFEDGKFGTSYQGSFYSLCGWIKGQRAIVVTGNIYK